jgi:hypothetical protein
MPHSFVLIHSPLIGPYSWQPVADQLHFQCHQVLVPSLLPALHRSSSFAGAIAAYVREAVNHSGLPDPLILAAHSAAGAYLPAISSQLEHQVQTCIFVDARLPRRDASLDDQDAPEEIEQRRAMAVDGILPPWSSWFDEGIMEKVLPQDNQRERFLAELQPIPLALFEEKIPLSPGWPESPCAYLRLSEFYKPLAVEARTRGWLVMEVDNGHLSLLTHPGETAGHLLEIIGRISPSSSG